MVFRSACTDRQSDGKNSCFVLQVPPEAGPDDRETMLHRFAAFLDELLGKAARLLGSRLAPAGETLAACSPSPAAS